MLPGRYVYGPSKLAGPGDGDVGGACGGGPNDGVYAPGFCGREKFGPSVAPEISATKICAIPMKSGMSPPSSHGPGCQ